MERVSKLLFVLILAFSIPFSNASGQDNKNEKKIKVIIVDDSGTKTVIDTAFTGDKIPETITLKDGKVIHLTKKDVDLADLDSGLKGRKILVTVSTDLDEGKETSEKVIIMSSDSAKWTARPGNEKGHVYVYSSSKSTGEKPGKYVVIASTGDKLPELEDENGIIISTGKVIRHDGDKSFSIVVDEDSDSDSDVTKYVIAKDGVVVTIESDDEAKAKELMKEIESRLDAKADTKKTEKK